MENNLNNNTTVTPSIKTLTELKNIVEIIKEIKQKLSLMTKENIDLNLQEQLNFYTSLLRRGLAADISSLKEEIFVKMEAYFKAMGLSNDLIRKIIDESKLFVSDINFDFNGKFVTYNNKIGMDYRYMNFDSNGNFIGINQESKDLVLHALIHEFFHRCSLNNKNVSLASDSLSEGFTDMFTINVLSSSKNGSARYSFFVKICNIFTQMVGPQNMFNDYINNIGEFTILKKLFCSCGLSEKSFDLFYSKCNKVLELIEKNEDKEKIEKLELQLIDFIKEYIVLPYYNLTNNIETIKLFNKEFSENKFDNDIILDSNTKNKGNH